MRAVLVAFIGTVVLLFLPSAWDRFVSEYASEWVLRLVYTSIVILTATYILFSDTLYFFLKNRSENEVISTILLGLYAGLIVGAIWLFWIVGWPSSLSYTNALVERWLKSLTAPWLVSDTSHPQTYISKYIDRADKKFGVGVNRPKDPKEDDNLTFEWELGLSQEYLDLFSSLSDTEKQWFIREVTIEVRKISPNLPNFFVNSDLSHFVYMKETASLSGMVNRKTLDHALHTSWTDYQTVRLIIDQKLEEAVQREQQREPTIDGTNFTWKSLDDNFPLGWIVFSEKLGNRMSNPPPAWDKLQFKIDPDNVHATPDFSKREVIWTVGLTSATKLTTGMNYYENQLNRSVPMKVGKVYRLDQLFEPSQPRIWVVTLGDNQRFPVFALGFRISQEPTPPSPTPDTVASPH